MSAAAASALPAPRQRGDAEEGRRHRAAPRA
jgi:hypothetical protein